MDHLKEVDVPIVCRDDAFLHCSLTQHEEINDYRLDMIKDVSVKVKTVKDHHADILM